MRLVNNYFVYDQEAGKLKCTLCQTNYGAINNRTKISHLAAKHPDEHRKINQELRKTKSRSITDYLQKDKTTLLLNYMVSANQPFSVVDNQEF